LSQHDLSTSNLKSNTTQKVFRIDDDDDNEEDQYKMPVVMSSKQQQDKDKRESEIEFDRVQIVDELHYLDK
jgi:hypothetical protein